LTNVISKKRHPGLRWTSRLLGHQTRDGPFGNLKPQLFQFTVYPRSLLGQQGFPAIAGLERGPTSLKDDAKPSSLKEDAFSCAQASIRMGAGPHV
jgi:hypothetical protein